MSCLRLDYIASDILQQIISYTRTKERHVIKLVNLHIRECVHRQIVKEIRSSITKGMQIYIQLPRECLSEFGDHRCRIASISKLDWTRNRMQIHSCLDSRRSVTLWCHISDDFGILWTWEPPQWVQIFGVEWYIYFILIVHASCMAVYDSLHVEFFSGYRDRMNGSNLEEPEGEWNDSLSFFGASIVCVCCRYFKFI